MLPLLARSNVPIEDSAEAGRALAFVGVFHDDIAVQSAAGGPATFDRGSARLYDGDKVVHDSVCHRLVENAFVAKPLQVHFQTLQLDANLVGNVRKNNRPKVRLARFRTDRREFGTVMFDRKIP